MSFTDHAKLLFSAYYIQKPGIRQVSLLPLSSEFTKLTSWVQSPAGHARAEPAKACAELCSLGAAPGSGARERGSTGRSAAVGESHPAPLLKGSLPAKATGKAREEKHTRPKSSEILLLKCSRVTDNWKQDCTTEIPAALSFHSSLGICCCAPRAIGCGLAGPLSDPGQMFCSSVKPQKQLQKQHWTNSTRNTYDTKMVWLSALSSRRQPPRHRQDIRICHSRTLGFRLLGGGRCAAYHPPFYTQRAFQHCCLCLQSHCRREVCDHQAPARVLCCSTVTVGFTSATSLCGNEVLPQDQSCSSAAETLVTEQKGVLLCNIYLSQSRRYHTAGAP